MQEAIIITTNAELSELSANIVSKVELLAIDTEFVRERSYYPALGLIQIFDGESVYLIDPLNITEWQSFVDVLENDKIIKIIHSCSEDIEVFKTALKTRPKAMYDTQVAESFCGGQNAAGLAVLVEKYTGVKLEKGQARTNWLKRPLTSEQLTYAASDVLYLIKVYKAQMQVLADTQFMDYAKQDVEQIIDKKFQVINLDTAWRDIKSAWQLTPRGLAVLKELVKWRLEVAIKKDLAVNFVVKERTLVLLAERRPTSLASLSNVPDIHPMEVKRHGRAMLECIQRGKQVEEEACPASIKRVAEISGYKKYYSSLKKQVTVGADRAGVSIELFASKRMINQVLGYHWQVAPWSRDTLPELYSGWRGEFAKELLLKRLSELDE